MKKNTVTREQIEGLLKESRLDSTRLGDKTTVVNITLPNGFVITESSSCVDPANYDHKIGVDCCMDRIKNKIWELEGYLLQEKMYWGADADKVDPVDKGTIDYFIELSADDVLSSKTMDGIIGDLKTQNISVTFLRHVHKKDACKCPSETVVPDGQGEEKPEPWPIDACPTLDPWKHRSAGMKCATCMWFVAKYSGRERPYPFNIGRCRKNAPTMTGYPVVYMDDWCGDHKLDENKI